MTKGELIKALEGKADDAAVWVEGCDCMGEAAGVDIQPDGVLLVYRKDSLYYPKER